jgi:hypothetical protein
MKPILIQTYENYVRKVQEAQKAEQEASITNQTNQWQQQQQPLPQEEKQAPPPQNRSLETSDVSTEWNLQDALKGVVGVGYNEESKYRRRYY